MLTTIYHKRNEFFEVEFYKDKQCTNSIENLPYAENAKKSDISNFYIEIKKGNTLAHKQYMQRSFALTFSAITLRVWNGVLINYTELIPLTRYMIIAWLGFVPNLLITEYLIWKRKI